MKRENDRVKRMPRLIDVKKEEWKTFSDLIMNFSALGTIDAHETKVLNGADLVRGEEYEEMDVIPEELEEDII